MRYHEDFLYETVTLYKGIIHQLRSFKMSQNKEGVSHSQIVPYATYSPWQDDITFQKFFELIKSNTLVDLYRCYELWNLVIDTKEIVGDILEVGVWRGGTGALMAAATMQTNSPSMVYLADTFSGVVKAGEMDTLYRGGEHADTSESSVIQLLADVGADNYQLLKGVFPDDVLTLPNINQLKLRFCHIDVDVYQSGLDVFQYIWPLMSSGGIVVFDDYGFWGCEGITNLCNELKPVDGTFIHNLNGHGIFLKR